MKLGILIALPQEQVVLPKRQLKCGQAYPMTGNSWLIISGMGSENARRAVQALSRENVDCILNFGCVAGLVANRCAGDLIVPKVCINEEGQKRHFDAQCHSRILNTLKQYMDVIEDDLLSVSKVIANVADKQLAHQRTGAVCADMESFAILEASAICGTPCVAIKSIADPLHACLPRSVLDALSQSGKMSYYLLIKGLLRNPSDILTLMQIARFFRQSKKAIQCAAKHLELNTRS